MNDFINKLIDDIHNINPELALERQTEYNRNFANKILNEQCNIADVVLQSEQLQSFVSGFYQWHRKQNYVSVKRTDWDEYIKTL